MVQTLCVEDEKVIKGQESLTFISWLEKMPLHRRQVLIGPSAAWFEKSVSFFEAGGFSIKWDLAVLALLIKDPLWAQVYLSGQKV